MAVGFTTKTVGDGNGGTFTAKFWDDGSGALSPAPIDQAGGGLDHLNITAATVIKTTAGRIARVSVIVAGTTDGTVNDCATTGAAAAANQIGVIPAFVGVTIFDWPCGTGIVVVPGTGQTLAVSYS